MCLLPNNAQLSTSNMYLVFSFHKHAYCPILSMLDKSLKGANFISCCYSIFVIRVATTSAQIPLSDWISHNSCNSSKDAVIATL